MCVDVLLALAPPLTTNCGALCVSSRLDNCASPLQSSRWLKPPVAMYDAPTAACNPTAVCRSHKVTRVMLESAFVRPWRRTRSCGSNVEGARTGVSSTAGCLWALQWSEMRDETVQCTLWVGLCCDTYVAPSCLRRGSGKACIRSRRKSLRSSRGTIRDWHNVMKVLVLLHLKGAAQIAVG
jgi:hypothetical protein